VRHAVVRDDAGIDLHTNLADYGEPEIAKAIAGLPVEISTPRHYALDIMVQVYYQRARCASLKSKDSRPGKSQKRKLS